MKSKMKSNERENSDMVENKKIELTDEQLEGVAGGYNDEPIFLRPDGKIEYCGDVFGLSTEEDYEYVLKTYGENFEPYVVGYGALIKYYDWYYQKFGRPHNLDER